jgi:hypothetical protein
MPSATVDYYDSEDEENKYQQDTSAVPFAARACEACNNASDHAHKLADTVAAASKTAKPIIADASKDAITSAERAGVTASNAVCSKLLGYDENLQLRAKIADGSVRFLDDAVTAVTPAICKLETLLAPYIQSIGELLLSVDRDICQNEGRGSVLRTSVLRALAGMESVGEAMKGTAAIVEERMKHVTNEVSALDHSLGKISHWGDTQLGICVRKPPRHFV